MVARVRFVIGMLLMAVALRICGISPKLPAPPVPRTPLPRQARRRMARERAKQMSRR